MRVDLDKLTDFADTLDSNANTPEGALVRASAQRIVELLSALAEVAHKTTHRGCVEAAQRGISGDEQGLIYTQSGLDQALAKKPSGFPTTAERHTPPSPLHEHEGAWWFWNEVWADRIGPYSDEAAAQAALDEYAKNL